MKWHVNIEIYDVYNVTTRSTVCAVQIIITPMIHAYQQVLA